MSTRRLIARGLIAVMLATASVSLTSGADAIPPCWQQPEPPPDCPEPDPAPPPPPPAGPVARNVISYPPGSGHAAVPAVHSVLGEVLDSLAPANRARLDGRVVTAHIIPKDWSLTDLPPWSDLKGEDYENAEGEGDPFGRTYDDLGGAARCGNSLNLAVGEEKMVELTGGDRPSPPVERLGNTLVHEVGHIVECAGLTPAQQTTLTQRYEAAKEAFDDGKTANIIGFPGTPKSFAYTTWTEGEFFAEATAAWFQRNDDERYQRAWVRSHDRKLYDLLDEVYSLPPAARYCDGQRATTVLTGAGATFTGHPGPDIIVGSAGSDTIDGESGDDVICGEGGDDEIHGGSGADTIYGRSGNDRLWGDENRDTIYGGLGDDVTNGGAGDDRLNDDVPGLPMRPPEPGGGDDKMYGGPGDDAHFGGAGDDYLSDVTDRDEFYGGADNDEIWAKDTVRYNPRTGEEIPSAPDQVDGGGGLLNTCTTDAVDLVRYCFAPGTG